MAANAEEIAELIKEVPGIIYRCLLDEAWTMFIISDEVERLSGYPSADFLLNKVRTFDSVIHPDDRQKVADTVEEAVANNHPYIIEYRIVHRDGSVRTVIERGCARYDLDHSPMFLDGVIVDVSART